MPSGVTGIIAAGTAFPPDRTVFDASISDDVRTAAGTAAQANGDAVAQWRATTTAQGTTAGALSNPTNAAVTLTVLEDGTRGVTFGNAALLSFVGDSPPNLLGAGLTGCLAFAWRTDISPTPLLVSYETVPFPSVTTLRILDNCFQYVLDIGWVRRTVISQPIRIATSNTLIVSWSADSETGELGLYYNGAWSRTAADTPWTAGPVNGGPSIGGNGCTLHELRFYHGFQSAADVERIHGAMSTKWP